jgi:hypothetical protein
MQEKVRKEKILILAKTYPSPSAQYVETSCVAGVNSNGEMRRLFPVPFRMIEHGQQFSKWQWIDVRVEKASKDHRRESHGRRGARGWTRFRASIVMRRWTHAAS